jgi:hypothetical protein
MGRTLSPQIVLLAHVRTVNAVWLRDFQTVLSRIVRQNLVSGSRVMGLGIWNLRALALNL